MGLLAGAWACRYTRKRYVPGAMTTSSPARAPSIFVYAVLPSAGETWMTAAAAGREARAHAAPTRH